MKNRLTKLKIITLAIFVTASTILIPSQFIQAASTNDMSIGNTVLSTIADGTTSVPKFEEDNSGAGGFTKPEGNGRIWVDKSLIDNKDGTFEVNLSALTQEYVSTVSSITKNTKAADVVFVLDGSSSMVDYNNTGIGSIPDGKDSLQRIQAMIKATNEAIKIIMDANPENRIAVYIYSGTYVHEFLSMNSYAIDNTKSKFPNEYIVWGADYEGATYASSKIYFNETLKDVNGNSIETYLNPITKDPFPFFVAPINSATPTQKGIVTATDGAINSIKHSITNNVDLKERQPFVFLLSDGGATYGSKFNFTDVNNLKNTEPNIGDGSENDSDILAQITANLILSSAYMKDEMAKAYTSYNDHFGYHSSEAKFYTVGLGNEINGPYVLDDNGITTNVLKFAWAGLNPAFLNKVKAGSYLDTTWPDQKKNEYLLATQTAADKVLRNINDAVDNISMTNPDLAKYKKEANYVFSSYYQYADSYAEVKKAFSQLANDVASATKENKHPVMEEEINGVKTSIHFEDKIGEGMMVDEDKVITLTGLDTPVVGVQDALDKTIYRFAGLTGFVRVDNDTVEWFMTAEDLEKCLVKIQGSQYSNPNPIRISYTVKLKNDAISSIQNVFYTNAFTGIKNNITGGTMVTYYPSNDNTYYFYTNPSTGIVGDLSRVGYPDKDKDISHYIKGTPITSIMKDEVLDKVYITTDLVIASQTLVDTDKLKPSDIGTVKDKLTVPDNITYQDELKKSIKDCQVAENADISDPNVVVAFHNGIQKEHEHEVSKEKNDKNPTETASLVSKEHFKDGKITMTLGNNGRITRSASIDKTVDKTLAKPGDTLVYTMKVTNYTEKQVTSYNVVDTLPSGLTDIIDATKSGIASFRLVGDTITWSHITIPASSSVDLIVTAKVPTNGTVTEYKNIANITNIGNHDLLTPASSNEVKTTISTNVILDVTLDGKQWLAHGKTYTLVNATGNTYALDFKVIPDGEYNIFDGSKDTGEDITIMGGEGFKTMAYVTLTLDKDSGIDSVKEKSGVGEPGTGTNQYIFLKGQTAKISADAKTGFDFVNWKEGAILFSSKNLEDVTMNDTKTLKATSTKMQFEVVIDATLDGVANYDLGGETVCLVDDTTGAIITDLNNVKNGTYTIYVGSESTNEKLTVNGADTTKTLHYFTLTLTSGNDIQKTTGSGTYLDGSEAFISAFVKSSSSFVNWTNTTDITQVVSTFAYDKIIINKTTHLTANAAPPAKTGVNVIIDVYKDDVIWNGHGKDIYLVDGANNRVNDLTDVQQGTYAIYAEGIHTGKTVVVDNMDVQSSVTYYTLTLQAGTGIQSVKETNSKYIFLEGQTATISTDIKGDYVFVGWRDASDTRISTNVKTNIIMNKKQTLTAYGEHTHKVIIQGNLDNAKWKEFDVSRASVQDVNGNLITDLNKVVNGTYLVFVDGEETSITFTVKDADSTVIIDFYNLDLIAGNGIDSVHGTGKYIAGTLVDFNAMLRDGYTFTGWSGDRDIADINTSITMDEKISLIANTEKKEEPAIPETKKQTTLLANTKTMEKKRIITKDTTSTILPYLYAMLIATLLAILCVFHKLRYLPKK